MTRPRLWSEDRVLGAAMDVFREQGFEATSLRDVERATGLHTGSLYQAYGSKAGVFEAALGAYNERVVAGRIQRHLSSASNPVDGLVAFFASTYADRPVPDPGCLITNSAVEAPHLSDTARGSVTAGLDAIRTAFVDALRRARTASPTGDDTTDALADQLLALYQGLLVLVRFGLPQETLARVPGAVRTLTTEAGGSAADRSIEEKEPS